MKHKPTFYAFLYHIYLMDMGQFKELDELQQKAIEVDYIDRYGLPIRYW